MRIGRFSWYAAAAMCVAQAVAQTFYTPTPRFITPAWRGSVGTEFSRWDVMYSPYGDPLVPGDGINFPDLAAPNGVRDRASVLGFTPPANASPADPFAFWHAANPTIRQTATPTAFIVGGGSIYSFGAVTGYVIEDALPFIAGTVVMQWATDGQLMDPTTLRLVAGGVAYPPTNFVTEYRSSGSGFGGLTNRSAAQWDLTGLGVTAYEVRFQSESSSTSLQDVLLDAAPNYMESVPSDRAWTAPSGLWSTAAHWSPASLPPVGGNVRIAGGGGVTVDGGVREIGELRLTAETVLSFAPGGGTLKINTGIDARPAQPAHYVFDAPVEFGALNLMLLNAAADLRFQAPVSGAGFYLSGPGAVKFSASNSFIGGVTVDRARLTFSAANAYTGATTLLAGSIVLEADALAGSGALGAATAAIAVGSGGTFAEPEAALLLEGSRTMARNVSITTGSDPKRLGGRNTGAGALFSGNVTLNATASGLRLDAELPSDTVTFSGAITGGLAAGTITKTGAGRVIFAGPGAKSYASGTIVEAGTLEVAAGATRTGTAAMNVAIGAALAGSGSIANPTSISGTHAPGSGIGTLTHSNSVSYAATAALVWELVDNSTVPAAHDQVLAGAVAVAPGARIDLHFARPGSAVDFRQLFWRSPRVWPVLTASALSGAFVLGSIGADPIGNDPVHYGSFSLAHSAAGVILQWAPHPAWESWRRTSFGTAWNDPAVAGELADFDRDGVRNLVEYALGTNGAASSASTAPARSSGRLALAFPRNAAADDVTIVVRGADAITGPWTPLAQSTAGGAMVALVPGVTVIETGTGPQRTVEVRDLHLIGDPARPRRFLQLHVER